MAAVPLTVMAELVRCEHYQAALPLLDEFIAEQPASLEALELMGSCLDGVGRRKDAIAAYQLCVLLDPDPYGNLVRLADLQREDEQAEEALQCAASAIEHEPGRSEAYASQSLALTALERFQEALEAADQCLDRHPGSADGWYAKGLAQVHLEDFRAAESCFDRSIDARPDWALPRRDRALVRLLLGNYTEAVDDYAQRWHVAGTEPRRHESIPTWEGEPFEGALLLWAEQGLGDEIFYLGLVPQILERHADVVIEVNRRLVPLATRSFPGVAVIEKGSDALRAFEVRRALPFASQLRLLVHWQVPLPLRVAPFLRAPGTTLSGMLGSGQGAHGSGPGAGLRIGVCWRSFRLKLGSSKSIDPLLLAPLTELPGVEIISLQHGDCAAEEEAFAQATGVPMKRPGFDSFEEIDRLAILIASCDYLVVIPGVAAHLGAALGVPTYVLSRSMRGRVWYWMVGSGQEPEPWYRDARVVLFEKEGESLDAIAMIRQELAHSYSESTLLSSVQALSTEQGL